MALEQKDKPKDRLDDENNPANKSYTEAGIDQAEAFANDAKNKDSQKSVNEQETAASIKSGNESAMSSAEGQIGRGYNPKNSKSKTRGLKANLSGRKKTVAGIFAAALVSGGLFISTILSGPLQIMQFANYLEKFHLTGRDSLTEGRLGNFYRYLKYQDSPEMRRVGVLVKRSAAKIEASFQSKGLTPVWQNGRLVRLDVNPESVSTLRAIGLDVTESSGRFLIDIDPPGTSARVARSNLSSVTKSIRSLDVKVGAIGMRSLRTKAGIQFLDSSIRRTTQNIRANLDGRTDAELDGRTAYEEQLRSDIESEGNRVRVDTTDQDGADPDNPDATRTESVDIDGDKASARSKVNNAGKGLAVIGLACAAYQIAEASTELRQANILIPLMRFGVRFASAASQIQAGAVDLTSLGYLADDLYDETAELGARSWKDAASIQTNLGLVVNGTTLPNYANPTQAGNFILEAFSAIPALASQSIGAVCGAVTSTAGQVIGYGVDIFTGGISAAIKTALGELIIGQYADDLVAILSGKQVDTSELKGALGGSAADWGMMLSSRENMIDLGGRELSQTEVAELKSYHNELLAIETQNDSLAKRYFSLNNPESLLAYGVTGLSDITKNGRVDSVINPVNSFASVGNSIGKQFTNEAYAQSATYDYDGISNVGFSLDEINDPRYQNPYENAQIVGPLLEAQKEKIENCFGKTVNVDGAIVPLQDGLRLLENEDRASSGCNDTSEEWTRIRFYVLDASVGSSHDCLSGDGDSCEDVGYADTFIGSAGTSLSAPGLNGNVIPCQGQNREAIIINDPSAIRTDWTDIPDSGVIGTASNGDPIRVFIREACDQQNAKTVLIVSSIHGSENGGQLIGHELLFNANLPSNVRIIVVPELNRHGILARSNGTGSARVNANGVNLNRNADYRWAEMNNEFENITPGLPSNNYRGSSPASEPETKAITEFIKSLGKIDLSLHYHDNLNYVGAAHSEVGVPFAREYGRVAGMPVGNSGGERILQKGSLDGWQALNSNEPVLLVELGNIQTPPIIQRNVDAIISIVSGPLFR